MMFGLLSLINAPVAHGWTNQFCAVAGHHSTFSYTDQSYGNVWTTAGERPLRGVYMQVLNNDVVAWQGYASTNTGCTPLLSMNSGTFRLKVWSKGIPSSNNLLEVRDYSGSSPVLELYQVAGLVSASWTYRADPFVTGYLVWKIYAAAAETIYQEPHPDAPTFMFYYEPANESASTKIEFGETVTHIGPTVSREKFTISHELGHQYLMQRTNNFYSNSDYGQYQCTTSSCPVACESSPAANCYHKLTSKENMTAAVDEAWGYFISALTWSSGTSCQMANKVGTGYEAVDCDSGTTSYPTGYLAGTCESCGTTWGDPDCESAGVELDWIRVFWNTNRPCSNHGSISNWLDVLDAVSFFDLHGCNTYQQINMVMTGEPMEGCWDSQVVTQRVRFDYGAPSCEPLCGL